MGFSWSKRSLICVLIIYHWVSTVISPLKHETAHPCTLKSLSPATATCNTITSVGNLCGWVDLICLYICYLSTYIYILYISYFRSCWSRWIHGVLVEWLKPASLRLNSYFWLARLINAFYIMAFEWSNIEKTQQWFQLLSARHHPPECNPGN